MAPTTSQKPETQLLPKGLGTRVPVTYEGYIRAFSRMFGALILELGRFCPVECEHCHVMSTKKTLDRLSKRDIADYIQTFSRIEGAEFVQITGGEPFSHRPLLKEALSTISSTSLYSYVLTSASWAPTMRIADNQLTDIPKIDLLGFSIDRYHLRRVPLSNIVNGIKAARSRSWSVFVTIGSDGVNDPFRSEVLSTLKAAKLESIPIVHYPLLARGAGADLEELNGRTLKRTASVGCASLGSLVVTSTGNVSACCNSNTANACRAGNRTALSLPSDLALARSRFRESDFIFATRMLGPFQIAKAMGIDLEADLDMCFVCENLQSAELATGAITDFIKTQGADGRLQALRKVFDMLVPEIN